MTIEEKIKAAEKGSAELQPWDGYYLVRGRELVNLLSLAKIGNLGKVLEIGCGNGFVAALLSARSKEVVATDLFSPDSVSHTIGMESARKLIARIAPGNVTLMGSSAGSIPFRDETFDAVFSLYTMQYLKERAPALKEIKRVIKKDGFVVLVVPNFTERIFGVIQFYVYFLVKFFNKIVSKTHKRVNGNNDADTDRLDMERLKKNYKYFPFPGPHGAYKNSAVELIRHIPANWNNEFRKAGFKISKSMTTSFIPYPLTLTISLKMSSLVAAIFEPFVSLFGNKPVLKYLGYNYCVVLKK